MTFNNAKQAIPERFTEKIAADSELRTLKAENVKSVGNVIHISEPLHWFQKLKALKEHQLALRISCENFIKEQKVRGPTT